MSTDDYEIVLGKLVLLKLYLLKPHRDSIDILIEELEEEYLQRKGEGKL